MSIASSKTKAAMDWLSSTVAFIALREGYFSIWAMLAKRARLELEAFLFF